MPALSISFFARWIPRPGYRLTVDLEQQTVTTPKGESFSFVIDPFRKHCLVNGLDEIGLTLAHADKIRAFENQRRAEQPWLFGWTARAARGSLADCHDEDRSFAR
jgi:3-isopropylmalate/(R)-2-methylmalate dehydratase small subunit